MKIIGRVHSTLGALHVISLICGSSAFSAPSLSLVAQRIHHHTALQAHHDDTASPRINLLQTFTTTATALALLSLPVTPISNTANADEWGRETEAPTLFTGETVMICKKRGPLGACLETAVRTAQNDNDKSLEYFRDPSDDVKKRQEKMIRGGVEEDEGNELIQRLRRQSLENKERNDNEVRIKTLMNDQAASFGPFDRQVVILNTDGKTFTLLENPQAMRLKKAGYIGKDRKFIIQPSQEVIDEALEGKNDLGDAFRGLFGGSDDAKVQSTDVGSASTEKIDDGAGERDVPAKDDTATE